MNRLNLNVYPNPAKENTVVSFDLEEKQQLAVFVQDVVGRQLSQVFSGTLGTGHYEFPVPVAKLSAGIYFVNFTIGKHVLTRKLIVNE